jgi:hypothetical protein
MNKEITGGTPNEATYNGILRDSRGRRVHPVLSPVRVVSPMRAVSPMRVVSPMRAVSPGFRPMNLSPMSTVSQLKLPILQQTPFSAPANSPTIIRFNNNTEKRKPKVITRHGAFDYDSKFLKHTLFGPVLDYAAYSESQKSHNSPSTPFKKDPKVYLSSNIRGLNLSSKNAFNSPFSATTPIKSYESMSPNGIKLRLNIHKKNQTSPFLDHSRSPVLGRTHSPVLDRARSPFFKRKQETDLKYIRFGQYVKNTLSDKIYSGIGVMITAKKNNKNSLILCKSKNGTYEDLGGKINFDDFNIENKAYNEQLLSIITGKKIFDKTHNMLTIDDKSFNRVYGGQNSHVDIEYQNTYFRSYLFSLSDNFDTINKVFEDNKKNIQNPSGVDQLVSVNLNTLFKSIKDNSEQILTDSGSRITISNRTRSILKKLFNDYQNCCGIFNMTTENPLTLEYDREFNNYTL